MSKGRRDKRRAKRRRQGPKAPPPSTITAPEAEALEAYVGTVPDDALRAFCVENIRVASMAVGLLRWIESTQEVSPELLNYMDRLLWQPLKIAPNVNVALAVGLQDIATMLESELPQGAGSAPVTKELIADALDEGRTSTPEEVVALGEERDGEE